MKTKAEIVQQLLDEGHITAEDAVVLLMGTKEKEYVYIPTYPAAPYNPYPRWQEPYWITTPFPNYSTTGNITLPVSESRTVMN